MNEGGPAAAWLARRRGRRDVLAWGARGMGAAALFVLGCRGDGEASEEPTTVRLALDWTPNTNHTGFFVADREGWYRDEGIALEVLPYSGAAPETLIGTGQADFGMSFQDATVYARASGLPIVSVMAVLQHIATVISVRADREDIQRPRDLDGKTYAGFGLPHEGPTMREVIRNDGGEGEFEVVTLRAAAYEALYSGDADFTVPFVTWEGIEAELREEPLRSFRYTDYGFPDYYQVVLASNEDWVAEHRDLAQRFIRATVRGFEYAAERPGDAAQHLIDANPGVFNLPELVTQSAQLLADEYYLDAEGRFGTQTLDQWTGYSRFLYESGILQDEDGQPLTSEPDWSTFFTNDLL
ncbi:MAG: ABC transporter substrate-binding protein [Dehalococcoidia bacterium]